MYKITLFPSGDFATKAVPFTDEEITDILSRQPPGSWADICRLSETNCSCDTVNFRDEAEADLEPLTLETFIEELV
jgi:hypothetical protein